MAYRRRTTFLERTALQERIREARATRKSLDLGRRCAWCGGVNRYGGRFCCTTCGEAWAAHYHGSSGTGIMPPGA